MRIFMPFRPNPDVFLWNFCVVSAFFVAWSCEYRLVLKLATTMAFTRLLKHGLWMLESRLGHFPARKVGYVQSYPRHSLWPLSRCSFSSVTAETHEDCDKEKITVTFVDKDGTEEVVKVPFGMSMLEAALENDIELEGACEGSLACSTCHLIVMDVDYYNRLEDPTDEENDMLDLALGLTETSRLGCQIIAKPELDGLRLALPSATRNLAHS